MNKVILLIEDNPDDGELALRAIGKSATNAVLINAHDGTEALNLLFGLGENGGCDASSVPHLILLDLNLPGVSGLEVLRRIRKDSRTRSIPVVMLTSSGQEKDILYAYCLGANGYLRKQMDYGEFCRDISQVVSYWLNLNQGPPLSADRRISAARI